MGRFRLHRPLFPITVAHVLSQHESRHREHVWNALVCCNKACVYEEHTKNWIMPVSYSLLTFEECTHVPNIFLFLLLASS